MSSLNPKHLKQLRISNNLFMGVIRNANATPRTENPHADEDNEEYVKARSEYINRLRESFEGSDALRCETCGISLEAGYHIHHLDGDHTNNDDENFSLRCPFCHMSEHLGFVGVNNLATVVYVPQIPQSLLNQIQIIGYCYDYIVSQMKADSNQCNALVRQQVGLKTLLQSIEATKAVVLRNFQTNDPLHFANVFVRMTESEYQKRAFINSGEEVGTFSGLRLLFDPSKYQNEIKTLAKHVLSQDKQTDMNHPLMWSDAAKILKQKSAMDR